jgi:hypothetical protein
MLREAVDELQDTLQAMERGETDASAGSAVVAEEAETAEED